jgi:hypothetical protein
MVVCGELKGNGSVWTGEMVSEAERVWGSGDWRNGEGIWEGGELKESGAVGTGERNRRSGKEQFILETLTGKCSLLDIGLYDI